MRAEKRRAGRAIRKRLKVARYIYQVFGVPDSLWERDRRMIIRDCRVRRG